MIYARFSSHNQREASIEQQVEWCMRHAEREKLEVIETYADFAISGRTDQRPAFQRMMADAKAGGFSYVIAWKSNRMGRDMLDSMQYDKVLKEYGIKTIYVEEDFDDTAAGRFALRNMMNVNQFYSEALAEDVKRGMMDNAKKCMVNGRPSYGYRKGADGRFEIVPEQAEVLREIFARIANGWHHIDIMRDLNERGIRNRDGRPWQRSTFDKMLRNEQYIGVYRFSDVRIDGGMPQIIDKQVFDQVQEILASKPHPRGRNRNVADYILTGKLYCGLCGEPMVGGCGIGRNGAKHHYYRCQGRHRGICSKQTVKQEWIEREVMDALRRIVLDDKSIDWMLEGYDRYIEKLKRESPVGVLRRDLEETEKAISNIMKAIEAGIFTDTTKERLLELEATKKDLKIALEVQEKAFKQIDKDRLQFAIEKYRDQHIDNKKYHKELLNTFVKAIYLYEDHMRIILRRGPDDTEDVPITWLNEQLKGESITDAGGHQCYFVQTKPNSIKFIIVFVVAVEQKSRLK